MSKNYFKINNFSDTFRKLDKIHNYRYLETKTPLEMQLLLISHLNDLGFEYEVKKFVNGKEQTEVKKDFPYLTKLG